MSVTRSTLLAVALLAASPVLAQNAKVSTLIPATLPLTGTELFYVVQGGVSKQTPLSSIINNTVSLVVGTTAITGGTSGNVEFNNGGVLGEKGVTGTGSVVLATSPVLTTPSLGTPSALTLTNATGLPNAGLLNSSVTIGSTNVPLGATVTIFAGLNSVTSTTFVGSLTGGASLDLPISALGTGVQTALGHGVNLQSGLSAVGPVFDVVAYGASPSNSASANVAAFQAAFTAAASVSGGVHIPCGVYSLNASITATVPSTGSFSIRGDGQACVQLAFAGANGIALTIADQFTSFLLSDFTVTTTDTTGIYTGFSITNPNAVTFGAPTGFQTGLIRNVMFQGADAYTTGQDYWNNGIALNNVSYVNILGGGYSGAKQSSVFKGLGISLQGMISPASYSVVINISGWQVQDCNEGVFYGDFLQGVTITGGTNITNCATGIAAKPSPTGIPAQLTISDSQFNTTVVGISIPAGASNAMNALLVHHNYFITGINSTGIIGAGEAFTIDNNFFQASSLTGTAAVNITNTNASLGGSINDNVVEDYAIGIENTSGGLSVTEVHDNTMFGNTLSYSASSGTVGFRISEPAALAAATIGSAMPTCAARYAGARFTVDDQTTVTFLATVGAGTGGGSGWGVAICNGTNYQFH